MGNLGSQETLTDVYSAAAVKIARKVDVVSPASNQHELNGVSRFSPVLGEPDMGRQPARFVWLDDDEDETIEEGTVNFYDARRGTSRTEYRLYYPSSVRLVRKMVEGDVIVLLKPVEGPVTFAVAPQGSSTLLQLLRLLGLTTEDVNRLDTGRGSLVLENLDTAPPLDQASRSLLERLGQRVADEEDGLASQLCEQFGLRFPPMAEFSAYARKFCEIDPRDDCDTALVEWVETEEHLFKTHERSIVELQLMRLYEGEVDVDAFVSLSLSVQNRRKARAGASLENHMEAILEAHDVSAVNNGVTENRSRPDFLFPDVACYADTGYPSELLTILGAKTTCKDRWRQVLSEAARVPEKHLLTLESPISVHQTDEMKAHGLQLVVPQPLQRSYTPTQQTWLWTLNDFVAEVKKRQEAAVARGLLNRLL
ncbi:type II restriction endonuclease [Propioniferax innocua]|uniref:EcoRII-like protein n=1 Tax=Propioniferax innocua TaxID=1753 RepID=A0A542ZPQ4_9ACTN|nr:type II restriction endonuclease [Propioniferax innocua]TQL62246.1 EcoRII-like protein [Propioniferax innocua]